MTWGKVSISRCLPINTPNSTIAALLQEQFQPCSTICLRLKTLWTWLGSLPRKICYVSELNYQDLNLEKLITWVCRIAIWLEASSIQNSRNDPILNPDQERSRNKRIFNSNCFSSNNSCSSHSRRMKEQV